MLGENYPRQNHRDGANKDQVRCGHKRGGNIVSGAASGDPQRAEEAGRKHWAWANSSPATGSLAMQTVGRYGRGFLSLFGPLFPHVFIEGGASKAHPEGLLAMTLRGPSLTYNSLLLKFSSVMVASA